MPAYKPGPYPESKQAPIYFPASATRLIVLSLCTLGLYQLFWFYRNWKLEAARTGEDISPFWRAFFAPLFAYSLFTLIQKRASEASVPASYSPGVLTAAFVVLNSSWLLPDPFWLISLLTFAPLLPVRAAVAEINKVQAPQAWTRSGFSLGDFPVVIGSWLVVLVLGLAISELAPGQFKVPYVREYTKSCTEVSISNGSTEAEARPACACMAQHLVDHYTPIELIMHRLNVSSSETEEAMTEARVVCGGGFTATYVRGFTNSCTQVAVSKGSTEALARRVCACAGQYLVDHHTSAELTLYESTVSSPETMQAVTEAMSTCQKQFEAALEEEFKLTYVSELTNSCTQEGVSEGLLEDEIRPVCSCIAQFLADHHTSTELTMYSDFSSPESENALAEAADACHED